VVPHSKIAGVRGVSGAAASVLLGILRSGTRLDGSLRRERWCVRVQKGARYSMKTLEETTKLTNCLPLSRWLLVSRGLSRTIQHKIFRRNRLEPGWLPRWLATAC